jgi:hypothetical protein
MNLKKKRILTPKVYQKGERGQETKKGSKNTDKKFCVAHFNLKEIVLG